MDSNVFAFFFENVSVSSIYEAGWYASVGWLSVISGVLMMIAFSLQSSSELIKSIGGKSDWVGLGKKAFLIAVSISLYFVIAHLVIDFFNAIYSLISRDIYIERLGEKLNEALKILNEKEYNFSWSDIGSAPLVVLVSLLYHFTYLVMMFVILATAIAHALIVSFLLFWGAVALPISISNGLDMLKSYKTMWLTVLIWPIIDGFLAYLISFVFIQAMNQSISDLGTLSDVDASYRLTFLTIYTVIHLFMIASMLIAYKLAQGISNGQGDITSSVNTFAGAGIAAGLTLGSISKNALQRFKPNKPNSPNSLNNLKNAFSSVPQADMEAPESNYNHPESNNIQPESNDKSPEKQAKRGAIINQGKN